MTKRGHVQTGASNGSEFPDYPTVPQAARRIGRPRQALYKAIRSGELPAYRMGSAWLRVRWVDCVAWVEAHRVIPDNKAEAAYFARLDRKAAARMT